MENQTSIRNLVTPDEQGAIYKVTGRTILNWEKAGIISAAVRVGRTIRFCPDEVEAQLAAARDTHAVDKP